MIIIEDMSKCTGCHACMSICPKACISMAQDEEGFLYPKINEDSCIGCGACRTTCPIANKSFAIEKRENICAYGAVNQDEDVRLKSSSGGIFTAIAEKIIDKGGVVFGAALNNGFQVEHISVDTYEGLEKLRGSKYVQSTIGNAYKETKKLLLEGKLVYFTGTPCQIGGLYSFLGKDYDNLITQDIICHGVPSPMVWDSYLDTVADREKIKDISFRDKVTGWRGYSYTVETKDDVITEKASTNLMNKAFLRNLCLRPSCYDCSYKTKVRQSDITLADFWGVENVVPELDDNKGTSLVVVNSFKGKAIFEEICHKLTVKEVSLDEAIKYNSAMVKSVDKPRKREAFISRVRKKGFNAASKRYLRDSFITRLKKAVKRLIRA